MDTEIWKDIPGYEGIYQVSNLGNVVSLKFGKKIFLKDRIYRGYLRVVLYKNKLCKNITIHRLVAITFIPNTYNKPCVNHINGIKTDNRAENLEWCTNKENTHHAFKIGLMDGQRNSKIVLQYSKDNYFLNEYSSANEASRLTLVNSSGITACCRGEYKSSGGFIWRFKLKFFTTS